MAADVTRTLAIKIVGDTKPLQKGLGKLGKIAAGAAVGGLFAVSYATIEGIKAFRKEQAIVKAFTRTVKNMGLPVANATRVMDRMANRAINLGFDDAETIQGMSTFVKLTGDINEAARLTSLAFDIARSKGIDLAAAQKIAAGIYKGNARALKDYGLEGVKGMEAVRAAARKERKQAAQWARDHPFEVGIGKISDAWADLVGGFANADFKGVGEALGKIGKAIQQTLFGRTFSSGRHEKGLIDKMGDWGKALGAELLAGIGKVDWGKTLSDTLNTAMGALLAFVQSGDAVNIAAVGAAIAAGVFAFGKFLTAAKAMFGLPGWLASGIVKVAAIALRGSFAVAMFAFGKFVSAAKAMFDLAAWGAKSIVKLGAKAVGAAFAKGAFVVSVFVGWATRALAAIGISKGVLSTAKLTGVAIGAQVLAGIATGVTGFALIKAVADELWKRFAPRGIPGIDSPAANGRQLPQDPLGDIWKFLTGNNATGTAGAMQGWSWVGERGPELVKFRGGEQVLNSRASVAAAGGSSVNLNVTVNAPVAADGARVGQELMRYIDQSLARATASEPGT